ncbi:transcription factor S [Candidatus Woesearchaeota archaeon CG10_big_fil_rev_8_21_14_0_10_37_12]|nr:MAG: transcription factor S [Candidatus Woesearchaeota archaeon CG10_big_fil_rev_8_21_14_0_10_37_12]
MKFCPKCRSLMMPRKEGGKNIFSCSCGYKEGAESLTIKESGKKIEEIAVVHNEDSVNVVVEVECPKCGNREAEYWEVQTRSADEPATKFHKCTKCKHTWRDYS